MAWVTLNDMINNEGNCEKYLTPISDMIFPITISKKHIKKKYFKEFTTLKGSTIKELINNEVFNAPEWKLYPDGKLCNYEVLYYKKEYICPRLITIDIGSWLKTLPRDTILAIADNCFNNWRYGKQGEVDLEYCKGKNHRCRDTKKWNRFVKKFTI